MVQMVRVLEADPPDGSYVAEVPGRPGCYVRAESIPELRTRLVEALAPQSPAQPPPQTSRRRESIRPASMKKPASSRCWRWRSPSCSATTAAS